MTAPAEYLLRVRPAETGFSCSLRQLAGTAHPEVRAVLGPVSRGVGATAPAAMLAAIADAHIGHVSGVREVPRHGC